MTRWFGLPGPLIGSTVAFVGVGLWAMPLAAAPDVRHAARARWRGPSAVPFAVGVVAAALLRALTRYHEPAGWAGLAAEMSPSALAMLAVSVTLLLTPEDRALWRLRLAAPPAAGAAP